MKTKSETIMLVNGLQNKNLSIINEYFLLPIPFEMPTVFNQIQ